MKKRLCSRTTRDVIIEVEIPQMKKNPDVIIWGMRFFVKNDNPDGSEDDYFEATVAEAQPNKLDNPFTDKKRNPLNKEF